MDFIEVSEGTSIKKEDIEAVIANQDGLTCTVRTSWNTYQSTFPYEVLVQLLSQKQVEPRELQQLNIMRTIGSFAG